MNRKQKTYKGEWYTINSLFGNDWALLYYLLGGRETGKSYSLMQWAVNRKAKKKEKMKFYWMRLTDASADKLLQSNGKDLVDPDLQRKYDIKLVRKGDTLYQYTPVEHTSKSGKVTIEKTDLKEFCRVLSLSTFYNNKGQALFDNEFYEDPENEALIVLDEMNRENSEKNSFDITYNFVNQIENIVRSTNQHIRIVMIGNTLQEASDLLSAINFIPNEFGRYKLKSKRAIVDYIKPNDAYKKRRKNSIANILAPNESTFTNEIEIDRSLLVNKRRCRYPVQIIKFSKDKSKWYTVWNDNIIKEYNKEQVFVIAMRKYLDEQFVPEFVTNVFERFNARAYRFTNIATFKKFQKELQLLKK